MPTSTETTTKQVYFFSKEESEGNATMRNLLGGKGANLAEMCQLGIPVPPGFTITTEQCQPYYEEGSKLSDELIRNIKDVVAKVEKNLNKKFGDNNNPLLFSVRSGARISMPGMMDTILNLGLNDQSVEGLAKQSGSERFAWDSYRRFIQMFSSVVLGVEHHDFETLLEKKKKEKKAALDTDLSANDLKELVKDFKELLESKKTSFPQDAFEQLALSIGAVFDSWQSKRAYKYREINSIPDHWGTAVNVQAMVFGNLGESSGTGVCFSRDPSTGENIFYGEYLINAQGEDVVAGIRTPEPISTLEQSMPENYKQLVGIYQKLELHFKEMQDMEFTIENNTLYILQTRTGKRTAKAAIKIAIDMIEENLIDKKTALKRVTPEQIDQLLHPMIDPKAEVTVIAKGLPASPGAAVGQLIFTADEAETQKEAGKKVILIREETSPEDIGGMHAAEGILTAKGGMTSHAAVVARGMGKCCIAGCEALRINQNEKTVTINNKIYKEGEIITLNGTTGEIIEGKTKLIKADITTEFSKFMEIADEIRTIKIRTNAETPEDVQMARNFGAEGIGLCRTEHMFFDEERILYVREMILSKNEKQRKEALEKIYPYQISDFIKIFEIMDGFPVTIRLLDPPLHEFLPHDDAVIEQIAKHLDIEPAKVKEKIAQLHETNPMLGHRGCRLGVTYPEIYEMQAKAIIQAAINVKNEGKTVIPEIMIPLISTATEFKMLKEKIKQLADDLINKAGITLDYTIGTMIEIPRAALTADQIAKQADFFSFGTNDLTQMTFGLSRDDAGKFLGDYVEKSILDDDPFQTLDQSGVGELIKIAIKKAKQVKPHLKIGICGEHGGDPKSIHFFCNQGFDYVSCSPFRVPIAKLTAALNAI